MTLPAHLAAGYLAVKLVNKTSPSLKLNSLGLMAGIAGAILPDIDFFFFRYIKDHHNSWLHIPLFWLGLYLLIYIITLFKKNVSVKKYTALFLIGIATHLFLDWFSGRTTGIKIFYPFSKTVYSLFPLNPQKGLVSTTIFPTKETIDFFKFYSQNTFLMIMEIAIIGLGFSVWLLNRLKQLIISGK